MTDVNTDVAYEFIRKRIMSGEYPPGYRLMTGMLAPKIAVSRTPVRDALRKLEADGLVVIRAHQGARVKELEISEYQDICDLRLALESHAAYKAALNHSSADLREIKFAFEAMQRLTERLLREKEKQRVLDEIAREDVRFHVAIMTAAKNEFMKKEILRLNLMSRIFLAPSNILDNIDDPEFESRRRLVLASHQKIYAAIARSDAAAARIFMEDHIQELIDHNLLLLARISSGSIADELVPSES